MELAEFVRARLDEDEAAAREVHEARSCTGCSDGWEAGFDPDRCDCGYPARVLREVAAKRKLIELADEATRLDVQVDSEFRTGTRDEDAEPYAGDLILRQMASVYSDHADYDQT